MTALPSPAATAKAEFERRRQAWCGAPGGIEGAPAQANLHLWLAIAAAAGCAERSDQASYLPELEWFRAERIWPLGDTSPLPVYPDDIAPQAEWQAELARAADTLMIRAWHPIASDLQRARAAAVADLARHLKCPLHQPAPDAGEGTAPDERKAA